MGYDELRKVKVFVNDYAILRNRIKTSIADQVEAIPAAMVEWFNATGVPLSEVYDDLASVTPIATEFLIESASGGSCVIRVVTSAYGNGADWENEFFAEMVAGWGELLDKLATRLNEAMQRRER